jgi:hypothetical protein
MADPLPITLGSTADPGTKLDPSSVSVDYALQQDFWRLVDDILGGKPAMQAAGELYLPRFQEEKQGSRDSNQRIYDPYARRLLLAPFTNIFEDILRNLASKPFSRELTLKEDTPKPYLDLAEDIDAQGSSFHVFGHRVFKDALAHNTAWILVDFTRATPSESGQPLTKADERAQGLRPYWVHIEAPRMLAAYSDFIDGVEIITHARFREDTTKLDDYLEVLVERVRVLWREPIEWDIAGKPKRYGGAFWALWERVQAPDTPAPSGVWTVVDSGEYTLGYLPLVPIIMGDRKAGTYQVEPPLKNLAYMQIDEYNQESNIQGVGDAICYPMFVAIGQEKPEGGMVVGSRSIVFIPPSSSGTQGDFKVVEPAGTSVNVMVERLKNTRTEMRDLGMQPLTQANLTVITTGQVAVKANSQVEAWAIRFRDALEHFARLASAERPSIRGA